MMELGDSSGEHLRDSKSEARSVLGIDLNEIPSPSSVEASHDVQDAYDVVRSFHGELSPVVGAAAVLPGEGWESVCVACGAPEVGERVVVCDGCERGFHLACVGMSGRQFGVQEEWVCSECVRSAVGSKRWPLGLKRQHRVMLLDMNASPPSEGEGEELQDSRKHSPGDNSFGGNSFGASETHSNCWYAGNGFGFPKASGILTHAVKLGLEDILHHTGRSFEEVNLAFPVERLRSGDSTAFRLSPKEPSDMFLQALKEFISERCGVLDEGWRVELKESGRTCEQCPVYHAPDGRIFESMSEVAIYLGLTPNCNPVDVEQRSERSASPKKRMHLPKRRKSRRLSVANSSAENKDALMTDFCKDISSEIQNMELCASNNGNIVKVSEAVPEENGGTDLQQYNNGLPVQFEDFFVLSLGVVDWRHSYHNTSQLWPVGYKSCWHDKLTGSLFICDVSDGGNSGPIFKVKRCACSSVPLPNGSTILRMRNTDQSNGQDKEQNKDMISWSVDYNEDGSLQTLLADPSPPKESDILSCMKSSSSGSCCVQTLDSLLLEDNYHHESSGKSLSYHSRFRDEIGEFSLQGRSSSSVWNMVSQKFIDACCETFKRIGSLKFFCEHVEFGASTPHLNIMDEGCKGSYSSLGKFCSSPGSVCMPPVIHGENELQTHCEILEKWLDHDRFGLDVEFVQEMLEQLPGVHGCSQYKLLKNRSCHSKLLTVGNGLLLAETQNEVQSKGEEAIDGLFGGSIRARKYEVGNPHPLMNDLCPPPGNPLGPSLSPDLVGDVIQVWESLWRFYEILGLKEPFSFEELEEELICPWSDDLDLLERFETETQENQETTPTGPTGASGHILPSSTDSGPEVSTGNPHAFIQMETGEKKEVAQAMLASSPYSRCFGVTLTKAHSSLLKALVSELQFKVAALVDPNFDSGESRSRRGRKKDADNAIPARRTKLNMLPINELTWPELARRYMLSVLSMEGNLDSAEITGRESGKVFRCLQGDGGVLCDSLTGVAGMQADALLFAEARKQIFGSLNKDDILAIEEKGSDATVDNDRIVVNDGNIPEWAQVLEPVRKLPTNVGTRIRNCVNDALKKDPPEWAKKILEHSISKEVYKGNASGPTKKAVLSVLGIVHDELKSKPDKGRKRKRAISVSDIIMKQCRIVLRRAVAADDTKTFCTLLGSKLINSSDNDDEGLLGAPAMVSRPLDFRMIDLRLACGGYGGSWEAFLEDMRENAHGRELLLLLQ